MHAQSRLHQEYTAFYVRTIEKLTPQQPTKLIVYHKIIFFTSCHVQWSD